MALLMTETHDCHAKDSLCKAECCPISMAAPVETCPKTHKVRER